MNNLPDVEVKPDFARTVEENARRFPETYTWMLRNEKLNGLAGLHSSQKADMAALLSTLQDATKKRYSDNDIRDTYDVNRSGSNVKGNTKWNVNTVTSTTYQQVTNGLTNGTMQLWVIEDGDAIQHTKFSMSASNIPQQYATIGRDRLAGIGAEDKYVLYDTVTGRLYRYAQSDSVDEQRKIVDSYAAQLQQMSRDREYDLNSPTNVINRKLTAVEDQLREFIELDKQRPLTNEEFAEYQKVFERYQRLVETREKAYANYTAEYSAVLEEYTAATKALRASGMTGDEVSTYYALKGYIEAEDRIKSGKGDKVDRTMLTDAFGSLTVPEEYKAQYRELSIRMRANRNKPIYMNEDYRLSIDDYIRELTEGVERYNKEADLYLNMDSSTQVNSLLDVAKRAIGRAFFDQFEGSTLNKDLTEYAARLVTGPITQIQQGVPLSTVALNALFSSLGSLGETADATNVFKYLGAGSNEYRYGNYDDPVRAARLRKIADEEYAKLSPEAQKFWIDAEGYAGAVAFKMWLGAYGDTPNFDYINTYAPEERGAYARVLTTFMDILLDPGSWIDIYKSGLTSLEAAKVVDSTATKYIDDTFDLINQAGVRVIKSDGVNPSSLRKILGDHAAAGELAILRNADTEAAIGKAYARAVKNAIESGGGEKLMREAVANARLGYMLNMFDPKWYAKLAKQVGRGLPANTTSKLMREYLGKMDVLNVASKGAYRETITKFTQNYIKYSVENAAKITKESGNALASVIYKTPGIVESLHSISEITGALNKFILVTGAPQLAAVVGSVRWTKKLLGYIQDINIAKKAAFAQESINKRITDICETHKAYSPALADAFADLRKEMSVLFASDKMSESAANFYKQFQQGAMDATVKYLTEDTLGPIRAIMHKVDEGADAFKVIEELDEHARSLGFDDFKALNDALVHNQPFFEGVCPDLKAVYMNYRRMYNNVIASKNLLGTERTIGIYRRMSGDIAKFFEAAAYKRGDVINSLENLHTLVQTMRDGFNANIARSITPEAYELASNRLIEAVKEYGDNLSSPRVENTLIERIRAFTENTEKYLQDLENYRDVIAYKGYVHRPYQEYIDAIAPKGTENRLAALNNLARGFRKELQRHHGLNVSADVIKEQLLTDHKHIKQVLFNAEGELETEQLGKFFNVTLQKYQGALLYTSDEAMRTVVKDALDINSAVNNAFKNVDALLSDRKHELLELAAQYEHEIPEYITTAVDKLDEYHAQIQDFLNTCAEQRSTQKFFNSFETAATLNQCPEDQINAVLDAFAGDKTYKINSYAKAYAQTRNSKYIENIVDSIIDDATEYLRQVSDKGVAPLWKAGCNTLNTADNVAAIEGFAKGYIEPDPEYIDVFYSCDSTVRNADPCMISFRVDGETTTFRNAAAPFVLHDSQSTRLYNLSSMEATEQYQQVAKQFPGTSKDEYLQNIQSYMNVITQRATDSNKRLRFIGFNSGASVTGSDRVIKDFLLYNGMDVRWNSAVDVAEIYRKAGGYAVIEDGTVMAIRKAITDTLDDAQLDVLLNNTAGRIVMDTDPKIAKQLKGLTDIINGTAPQTMPALSDFFKAGEEVVHAVEHSRTAIVGDALETVISEKRISDFIDIASKGRDKLHRVNSMRALYNAVNGQFNPIQLKKTFDTALMEEWFSEGTLKNLVTSSMTSAEITERMDTIYELSKRFNSTFELIENPELLDHIGADAYKEVYEALVVQVSSHPRTAGLRDMPIWANLELNTAAEYYSAIMVLRKKYANLVDLDTLFQLSGTLRANEIVKSDHFKDALCTIYDECAAELVYNSAHSIHRYATTTALIENKYAGFNNRVVSTRAIMDEYKKIADSAESLGTYLDLKEAAYQQGRWLTHDNRINYELYSEVHRPFTDLVDALNEATPSKLKFAEGSIDGYYNYIIKHDYDKQMAAKLKSLSQVNTAHKRAAVETLCMLSDEDFEKHLVRDCMNMMLIDPKCVALQGEAGILFGKRMADLTKNTRDIRLERVVIGNHEYISIYKDLSGYTPKQLDDLINSVDEFSVPVQSYKGAFNSYVPMEGGSDFMSYARKKVGEYLDKMSEYMPSRYLMSNFEVLTSETVQNLQQYFPEASRIAPGRINNWFNESYNCSIIGDIDTQRLFNPYASDKLIDNMARGLHHVQDKMEATTNYLRLFSNPSQSLRSMLNYAGVKKPDWKTIKQQLDVRGYTLVTLTLDKKGRYNAVQRALTNQEQLTRYLADDSVVVMERSVLGKVNEYILSQRKLMDYEKCHASALKGALSDIFVAWKNTTRAARILGLLFLSNIQGSAFRNRLDSTLKAVNEAGLDVLDYMGVALEYQQGYKDIVGQIVEKYKVLTVDTIDKYFKEFPDATLPQDLFEQLYVFNNQASTGMSALLDITKDTEIAKMRSLLPAGTKYTDDQLKEIADLFNRVSATGSYQKHILNPHYAYMPGKLRDKIQSQMYDECYQGILHMTQKGTKTPIYTPAEAKELANLFYTYTPSAHTASDWLQKLPVIGTMLDTNIQRGSLRRLIGNAQAFQDAETRTRTAMFLHYMEEGKTASYAEQHIVKSQFDYSKVGLIGHLETALPFSTFKIYNAAYWLAAAGEKFSTLKMITRFSKYTSRFYDTEDIAARIRDTHVAEWLADPNNGVKADEETPDATDGIMGWFAENIFGYQGVNELYAEGLRLGDNHYVKVGNSFTEAIQLCIDVMMAPEYIKRGQLPPILMDSVYTPLGVLFKFLADRDKNDFFNPTDRSYRDATSPVSGDFVNWAADRYYDILNLIPAFGMLANLVLTHIKNGAVNIADLKMMLCDENLKDAYMHKIFQATCDGLGTFFPSIVGTINDDKKGYYDREIGLNWYDNTNIEAIMQRINPETGKRYTKEEAEAFAKAYKGSHQFVAGISSLPAFMLKDPATYINYKYMFMRMGFGEKDVEENMGKLLDQLYGDGTYLNGIYINNGKNNDTYINIALLEDTFAALAAKGYDIDEVILQLQNQRWVNPATGELLKNSDLHKMLAQSAFLSAYEHLPDYVKYDKEQYAALIAYWKANGLTTEQAWMMMQSEYGYIDERGRYRILTEEQAKAYSQQLNDDYYEFLDQMPDWCKYEPGAASRTMNYFIGLGMSMEDAQRYILAHNAYVDVYGQLHQYSDEEVAQKNAQSQKEFYEYYNTLPDYIKYEKGAYGRTLKYLKSIPGMTDELARLFIRRGAYLTVDGRLINCTDMEQESNYTSKWVDYEKPLGYASFNDYYQTLPNYLKYEKGAFSRAYHILKSLGFAYNDILALIKQGAYAMEAGTAQSLFNTLPKDRAGIAVTDINTLLQKYGGVLIEYNGKYYTLLNCTGLNRSRSYRRTYNSSANRYTKRSYTKWNRKKYTRRPSSYIPNKFARPKNQRAVRHYYRSPYTQQPYVTKGSYSSTYSKVNLFAGASYGARQIYKIDIGRSPVRQALSTKSVYPAAYRNIVFAYRRSLYKDMYAKYGASRMRMRANVAHSYSNASIVRLRRNEIQYRVKYATKRSDPVVRKNKK